LETFDLEDFKYNFVNISAFRIVDAESNFTRQLLRDMEKFQPIGQSISSINPTSSRCVKVGVVGGNYKNFYLTNFIPIILVFCFRFLFAVVVVVAVVKAEPALVYDSVMALAHGLAALDRGTALRLANLSCDIEQPWNDGSSLFNYINTVCSSIYIVIVAHTAQQQLARQQNVIYTSLNIYPHLQLPPRLFI
jgi:ionotropic kainate glutamate receptor 2